MARALEVLVEILVADDDRRYVELDRDVDVARTAGEQRPDSLDRMAGDARADESIRAVDNDKSSCLYFYI